MWSKPEISVSHWQCLYSILLFLNQSLYSGWFCTMSSTSWVYISSIHCIYNNSVKSSFILSLMLCVRLLLECVCCPNWVVTECRSWLYCSPVKSRGFYFSTCGFEKENRSREWNHGISSCFISLDFAPRCTRSYKIYNATVQCMIYRRNADGWRPELEMFEVEWEWASCV